MHPLTLRLLAEDLVRRRRADDRDRYASAQRRAIVDPNPHQIDAVVFALGRLPEGGCILADEVGLGKTIEAGLVVAQGMAEGLRRVLLVVPKPLVGQWQAELLALFGLEVREVTGPPTDPGVWIVGRETAGSERGQRWLGEVPFDLCVIDEAHEVFAGIWRRFDGGTYDESSDQAITAHRVRAVVGAAPVLLLTATPLQNSLAELWGLVQYVEKTGTLLGDLPTFRELFCGGDDRTLLPEQAQELQRRLATVCQRTLRRQAQEFLELPFVGRRCRLFEYDMSDAERALYDDVTDWLMRPTLHSFAGRQRRLLLIGFHRRMASSIPALARALDGVVDRLRRLLDGRPTVPLGLDLDDDDDLPEEEPPPPLSTHDFGTAAAELAEVESFVTRARALPVDTKARHFQAAIRLVTELGQQGQGSGKALVFTESLTTQEYIRDLLLADGLAPDEVTLFRGVNEGPRVQEALDRWRVEEAGRLPAGARPSRDVAVRMALVHEFRTRSRVLVCTEAGAKGLNLQFCETVINYDLPWNPQRIEQRIGRCHRYRQARDVTVVNFLARDNEAHKLTFDILSQKLELFGRVLDASDNVLHEPTTDDPGPLVADLAAGFVADLSRIYDQARSLDERAAQIEALRDAMDGRRRTVEEERARTASVIERSFDDRVRRVFRGYRDALAEGLSAVDGAIGELVAAHLAGSGATFSRAVVDGRTTFVVGEGPLGPCRLSTGHVRPGEAAEPLTLGHPIVVGAIAGARAWEGGSVRIPAPTGLERLVGRTGVLHVVRARYEGFEPVERLVAAAVVDGEPLTPEDATRLARGPIADAETPPSTLGEVALDEALDEAMFVDQAEVEDAEQRHFERALAQLERFVEDRVLLRRRSKAALERGLAAARKRRDEAVGPSERHRAHAELARLEERLGATTAELASLVARQDEDYQRWRRDFHDRRFRPPTVTPVLTAHFTLTQGTS